MMKWFLFFFFFFLLLLPHLVHFMFLIAFRQCLVECKIFSECKIFLSEYIFGKGKYFQMFGCIPKNTLENIL